MANEGSETPGDHYERDMVPAMFRPFALDMVARLDLGPGIRILDVGCGTGIVARLIADRLDAAGTVIGVDINVPMLDIARRASATFRCRSEWHEAPAEALPISDASVDLVVSQAAIMFFEDKVQATREMHRVLRPGGRLYVGAWRNYRHQPHYAVLIDGLERLVSAEAADLIKGAFRYESPEELGAPLVEGGFATVDIDIIRKDVNFTTADHFVRSVVAASVLARMGIEIPVDVLDGLCAFATEALQPYALSGELIVPMESYLAQAVK